MAYLIVDPNLYLITLDQKLPGFKLEVSLASLDRIMPLDSSMICFGHYGFGKDVKAALKGARDQLSFWVEVVRSELAEGEENLENRVIAILKKEDAAFAIIKYLAEFNIF